MHNIITNNLLCSVLSDFFVVRLCIITYYLSNVSKMSLVIRVNVNLSISISNNVRQTQYRVFVCKREGCSLRK